MASVAALPTTTNDLGADIWASMLPLEDPNAMRYDSCQAKDFPDLTDDIMVNSYLPLLRPCKTWHATYVRVGDEVVVEDTPGATKKMTVDEYNASDRKARSIMQIRGKPVSYGDLGKAYLWDVDAKDEAKLDQLDVQFLSGFTEAETEGSPISRRVFYGLHSYGGYYGFFRPDLGEVIRLISKEYPVESLSKYAAMFVTTEMHPSDNIGECYDVRRDRHRAKTTVWAIRKPPAAPLPVVVAVPVAANAAPAISSEVEAVLRDDSWGDKF